MLALRYLRPRRKEAFISVIAGFSFLGIMLGVATLVVVMAVMNGFRAELLDKILGINGHIIVQPIESDLTDYDEVAKRIAEVPGVKAAMPIIEGQALASGPSTGSSGVLVRGIRGPDLLGMEKISGSVEDSGGAARLRQFRRRGDRHRPGAVARRQCRRQGHADQPARRDHAVRHLAAGKILSGRRRSSRSACRNTIRPTSSCRCRRRSSTSTARTRRRRSRSISNDPDEVGALRAAVEEAAKRPVFTTDWRMRNVTFFNALQVERNVMFLILALIVLVAALNIISGLIMLVKDKGRDIAILRTMGATSGAILRVFFITGACDRHRRHAGGAAASARSSAPTSRSLQRVRHLGDADRGVLARALFPLHASRRDGSAETTAIVVMALALSYLATLYPAWRAARLDPVEALRYE